MTQKFTPLTTVQATALTLTACGSTSNSSGQWNSAEDIRSDIEGSGYVCTTWEHNTGLYGPKGDGKGENWECLVDDEYLARIDHIEDLEKYKADKQAKDGTYPGIIIRDGWGIDCFGGDKCEKFASNIDATYWG